MKNYTIDKFISFVEQGDRKAQDILKWFSQMNKTYKSKKKNGTLTDDDMFKITEFWHWFQHEFGDEVVEALEMEWDGNIPSVINAIEKFEPRYSELAIEIAYNRLNDLERSEAEELFRCIWNKEKRTEITASFYDWERDEYADANMIVPRVDREYAKAGLKMFCADLIYNRGRALIKFFVDRGKFEYCAVIADGDGTWRCMEEAEIQSSFISAADHTPVGSHRHEKIIKIRENEIKTAENLLFFDAKKGGLPS